MEVFSFSPKNRSLQFPGWTGSKDVAKSGKLIKCKLWMFSPQLCSKTHGLFVALNEHPRNNHNRHLYGTVCLLTSFLHSRDNFIFSITLWSCETLRAFMTMVKTRQVHDGTRSFDSPPGNGHHSGFSSVDTTAETWDVPLPTRAIRQDEIKK